MVKESDAAPPPSRRRLPIGVAAAALVLVTLLLSACVSVPDRDPASGCANCPVCLHNADLGCVCVKVEKDTPRVEWNGKTWYFCSEECKKAFLSDPKRFNSTAGK